VGLWHSPGRLSRGRAAQCERSGRIKKYSAGAGLKRDRAYYAHNALIIRREMKPLSVLVAVVLAAPLFAQAQQHPRDREIPDPDTLAWWHTTEALSNDGMEGRDTGSAAYQRAAEYVASRFKASGLEPAGENGGYFQSVPMHEVSVTPEGTSFALVSRDGAATALTFLQQITIAPAEDLPAELNAALTFRGYCGKETMADIAGKVVVCFGTQREGMPGGAVRVANAREGNALGLINVDDPYFTIEPPRWPFAYARTVTLRSQATEIGRAH